MNKVHIDYYSDILCIWAYIGHARTAELQHTFAQQLSWSWHYMPVFGDFHHKMQTQWSSRGGAEAYAAHVEDVVQKFDHIVLHEACWTQVQPVSSAPAHLWLAAARIAERQGDIANLAEQQLSWAMRLAFFKHAVDISQYDELSRVVSEAGIDPQCLVKHIHNGSAYAELCLDMMKARDLNIRISPSYAFNSDRQLLTGNVGYRIIEANIKELLDQPHKQQSWC